MEEVVESSFAMRVPALGKGKDEGSTLASTEPKYLVNQRRYTRRD